MRMLVKMLAAMLLLLTESAPPCSPTETISDLTDGFNLSGTVTVIT